MVAGDPRRAGGRAGLDSERVGSERGQVVVLVVLLLVVLLGMAALVVDVGYAYYAHRSLQASADAAALAGAQALPDGNVAEAVARQYSASSGSKNELGNVGQVTTTVTSKCIASIPGCDPKNAVVVVEGAPAKSFFAGLFGIDSFKVKATSTACSPCGVLPLDIMMVLDRTGSMCQDHNGNSDPTCADLNNAREGMKTFLAYLDPTTQWVGLAVLPPASTVGNRCNTPNASDYNSTSAAYTVVQLASDYAKSGVLDTSSNLVKTINCQKGAGVTAYADALEAAQKELERVDALPGKDRASVKNVIIFLSDGAANTGPSFYSLTGPKADYRKRPCTQGVASAGVIKGKGTRIYSIGYDLDAANGGANVCQSYSGSRETGITAYTAIRDIASPGGFYNKPDPGQLRTIFTEIAADLQRGTAALIDD